MRHNAYGDIVMVMSVETQTGGKWPSDLEFWVAAAGTRATGVTREGSRWPLE